MPDTPVQRGEAPPYPASLEARAAAVEAKFEMIDAKLDRVLVRLDKLDSVAEGLADLRHRVSNLPTTWQMMLGILGAQVTLVDVLAGAVRLLGFHG